MSKRIQPEQFKELFLRDTPLVDVRAPVEYLQGSLPGAINLPILNDSERQLIGTTYKKQGQEAAVQLGYQIVSGQVKESRVSQWADFAEAHPQAVYYCFRGGKRSQITQQWLREKHIDRPIIEGGYKAVRTFLMEEISRYSVEHNFTVITGSTGSGKTRFLHLLGDRVPFVDLEQIARHRGSAFGAMGVLQPTQIDFENMLAVKLMKLAEAYAVEKSVIVEDESRLIGSRALPVEFFEKMRAGKVVWIDETLDRRIENIFQDYILDSAIGFSVEAVPRCAEEKEILINEALRVFDRYRQSMQAISRKLGGLRTKEVLDDLQLAESQFLDSGEIQLNKVWIEKLLQWYYDPLYLGNLQRRQPEVIFKGSFAECLRYFADTVR